MAAPVSSTTSAGLPQEPQGGPLKYDQLDDCHKKTLSSRPLFRSHVKGLPKSVCVKFVKSNNVTLPQTYTKDDVVNIIMELVEEREGKRATKSRRVFVYGNASFKEEGGNSVGGGASQLPAEHVPGPQVVQQPANQQQTVGAAYHQAAQQGGPQQAGGSAVLPPVQLPGGTTSLLVQQQQQPANHQQQAEKKSWVDILGSTLDPSGFQGNQSVARGQQRPVPAVSSANMQVIQGKRSAFSQPLTQQQPSAVYQQQLVQLQPAGGAAYQAAQWGGPTPPKLGAGGAANLQAPQSWVDILGSSGLHVSPSVTQQRSTGSATSSATMKHAAARWGGPTPPKLGAVQQAGGAANLQAPQSWVDILGSSGLHVSPSVTQRGQQSARPATFSDAMKHSQSTRCPSLSYPKKPCTCQVTLQHLINNQQVHLSWDSVALLSNLLQAPIPRIAKELADRGQRAMPQMTGCRCILLSILRDMLCFPDLEELCKFQSIAGGQVHNLLEPKHPPPRHHAAKGLATYEGGKLQYPDHREQVFPEFLQYAPPAEFVWNSQ